mmetsp:Transcript_16717/g.55626  ORF Transcript_16717/g.55626 Transcript_16717/m.55626 type:complete len:216 (+) Transcript_16717:185-832(+)
MSLRHAMARSAATRLQESLEDDERIMLSLISASSSSGILAALMTASVHAATQLGFSSNLSSCGLETLVTKGRGEGPRSKGKQVSFKAEYGVRLEIGMQPMSIALDMSADRVSGRLEGYKQKPERAKALETFRCDKGARKMTPSCCTMSWIFCFRSAYQDVPLCFFSSPWEKSKRISRVGERSSREDRMRGHWCRRRPSPAKGEPAKRKRRLLFSV